MTNLVLYSVNINGLNSKIDSFVQIITDLSPDVITVCELKTTQISIFKQKIKKLHYEIIFQKSSGIATIAKQNLQMKNVTTCNHSNIISALITRSNNKIRIINIYGLQESDPAADRTSFFEELEVEIEHCILNGENPIIAGDINAKIVANQDQINSITPNGSLLLGIINKFSLKVLNFEPCCTGKWTRSIVKEDSIEKSVLDYVITDESFRTRLTSIVVDEEKVMTPFWITSSVNKVTYSDHSAIITKFEWRREKELGLNKERSLQAIEKLGWKINSEGLKMFNEITANPSIPVPNSYSDLESSLDFAMNRCFKSKRKKTRNRRDDTPSSDNLKIIEIFRSYLKKGKQERHAAMEMINVLKKQQLEKVQEARAERVLELLNRIQTENGDFSPDKFWKLKKTITPRNDERTSIINGQNIEVFDTESILEEFKKEFKSRLSHRPIDPHLAEFENTTNRLLETCLKSAATTEIEDFSDEEVERAIHTLKQGKAAGTDLYPPDVFIHAGATLRSHITQMFNKIKNNLEIPESWYEVIVATIFKNKGSKKRTKFYRGVFLACVLYKIFEKVIKQRISPNLELIDLSQAGARTNKSPGDSVFLLNALKDHAFYLNSPLYVTFYDYTTCFDSLWLEDSMLSLWNLGIQNRLFNLIYLLNEKCNIIVKTPHGKTTSTPCPRIVKQGTVLSGNLCTSSTGELNNNLETGGAPIITANIKASLFVDDTWTPSTNVLDSTTAHEQFVCFTKRKRLGLNDKCVALAINLKKGDAKPILKVNGEEIDFVGSTKCLGDVVTNSRSNKEMINHKLSKGKAAMVSILAMCTEVAFGTHYISTGLLLYRSVFIPSLLFNSDVWPKLTKTETNQLQTLQLKTLKRIVHAPNSTSNSFIFLELGILPIKFEIIKRKLMFLHHIQTLRENDPVKLVYKQQQQLPFENNWCKEVQEMIEEFGISVTDLDSISRNIWKNRVNAAILQKAHRDLYAESSARTKTKLLKYETLCTQEYIKKLPAYLATFLLKIRSKTLPCKINHSSSQSRGDSTCRLCKQAEESQEHTINCMLVSGDDEWLTLHEYMTPQRRVDEVRLRKVFARFKKFVDLVDDLE